MDDIKLTPEQLDALVQQKLRAKMAELGSKGGTARAKNLSKRKLSNIGKKGAAARKAKGGTKP